MREFPEAETGNFKYLDFYVWTLYKFYFVGQKETDYKLILTKINISRINFLYRNFLAIFYLV